MPNAEKNSVPKPDQACHEVGRKLRDFATRTPPPKWPRSQASHPRIWLKEVASQKSICPNGKTYPKKATRPDVTLFQENSQEHRKRDSDARFSRVPRQPTGKKLEKRWKNIPRGRIL
ncbi:hypothetical protein [Agrobacterium rosae]|uniref:hypothetical protein n=1 Tax=Agrobacterium rosae TaxID=1972867 RepID=UPI003A7FA1CC